MYVAGFSFLQLFGLLRDRAQRCPGPAWAWRAAWLGKPLAALPHLRRAGRRMFLVKPPHVSHTVSVLVFLCSLRFKELALTSSWFFLRSIISSRRDSICISRSDLLRVRLSNKGRRLLMSASTFCRRPYSVSYLRQGQCRKVSPGLGFSVLLLLTLFMKKFTYFSISVSAFVSVPSST